MTKDELAAIRTRAHVLPLGLLETLDKTASDTIDALNGGCTHLQATSALLRELSPHTLRILIVAARDLSAVTSWIASGEPLK